MIYFIIALLLFVLEELYFRIADKYNIIDKPNLRSSHTKITLRGGGVIFYFAALLYFVFNGFQYPWFILGLTLISTISFIDDIHSLPNRYRLSIQFLAMLLMCYQWGIVSQEDFLLIVPALILCTGIINAYNFMDGINGITGGYSLAVLFPLLLLNKQNKFIDDQLLFVSLISILIFCFYNFRIKAKCFAGDVGSVSIAFILIFALGCLILQTKDLSYLTFLMVYGVDSLLTIAHRILLHENIFKAHRKHLYQIMANELQLSHPLVSSIYMLIQLAVSLGFIWIPISHSLYFCISAFILGLVYLLFMKKYYHLHEEYIQGIHNSNTTPSPSL